MRFDPDPNLKRDIAVGTISGLGIATFVTVYLHVQRLGPGERSVALIVFFGLFLSGPLIVGGLQFLRNTYDPADSLRVTGWVLLGSVPILLLTILFLTVQSALQVVLGDPFILLSGLVGLGALAGLAFGLYEVELRNAKREIQETANRLDAIISGSPIPIVALDADGNVTRWNEAAEERFKYAEETVLGEPYPLAPPDLEDEFEEHMERLEAGEELLGVETVRERRDGVRLDVEIWTSRILDDSGSFDGVMGLIPDISNRKRREQQLQVLHRVLRHNLRNDLNVIYGNLTRLEDRLGPLRGLVDKSEVATGSPGGESETALRLEELESAMVPAVPDSLEYAGLLRRKVDDLIDMTEKAQRAEAILRSVEDEHTAIDIETLLTDSLDDFEPQYPDAEIEMEIGHTFEVLVNGPVGIAIRELVENAILHTELEEPVIELTAFKDGTRACIEVHDEGPGIPAEERQVILQEEESAMLHSSGLGLWLANWLVNRSGGTLTFQEEDGGTTARIELPLAESTASSD